MCYDALNGETRVLKEKNGYQLVMRLDFNFYKSKTEKRYHVQYNPHSCTDAMHRDGTQRYNYTNKVEATKYFNQITKELK